MSPSPVCVVCESDDTVVFAGVRGVPVHTTVLWQTRAEAQAAAVGDIDLTFCRSCGHIFNPRFEASKTEYTQAYDNSLHFSPLFQRYAEGLADRLIQRYGLRGKDVLEIGAGKGDFLALMVQRGNNRGIGFDPSYVPGDAHRDLREAGQMIIHQKYFDPEASPAAADLLVCRQVLEHIERPRLFLERLRATVSADRETVVFFEVPNAMCPLRDMDVWTLIYEHCGFYTPHSLGRLLTLSGFEVLALEELYEGIFLGVEARVRPQPLQNAGAQQDLKTLSGLVGRFSQRFREKVSYWESTLSALHQADKRVVIWGSGARGVSFLNMVKAASAITYAVDINPRKEGTFIPGSGQRIVSPSYLQGYRPEVVVLMNPIYRAEVASVLQSYSLAPEMLEA
jgi:2-polyprenyl-3-methyl-5-hydroxy-6-metoxy-1,4-benzoquinol methylase